MRRNRQVSLSIPCVAGPNTTVSCKLSLVSNRYRKNTAQRQGVATSKDKYEEQPGSDERFVYNVGTIQSISTSSSVSDSGMFDFSSGDDRYRPFEGTGTIGTWQIEMPARFPQFDYGTINDVILHLRYTARDGGSTFKVLVEDALGELLNEMVLAASRTGLFQAFNLRRDLSNEWHRLKQANAAPMTLQLDNLPFFVRKHTPALDKVTWMARVKGDPALFVMSVDGALVQPEPGHVAEQPLHRLLQPRYAGHAFHPGDRERCRPGRDGGAASLFDHELVRTLSTDSVAHLRDGEESCDSRIPITAESTQFNRNSTTKM